MGAFFQTLNLNSLFETALSLLQESTGQGVREVGNNLNVVLAVTLMIWLGLFAYMMMMDRKLKRMEEQIDQH